MHRAALICLLAVLAAGCGSKDEMAELRLDLSHATPNGSRPAGACTGHGAFIEPAWWKCIVVVRGTPHSVIADIAGRLRRSGFEYSCSETSNGLEVVGARDHTRVIASARTGVITFDESVGGKPLDVVSADFAPPGARKIPVGFVGVNITAGKLGDISVPYRLGVGACPAA